jgi:NAD(P)-dependent dehydrogenase (short-subunit alcohol dehydrogenase family)
LKNYLIIGASAGIGRQLALQLADQGNQVFATYNTRQPDLNHANIAWHPLNVLDDTPDTTFLPLSLDGLAYCPGSINLKPFARIKPDDFAQDYRLQVLGAVKILQAALPALKKSSAAAVVLFSTVAVQTGFTFHSLVSSSKGALEGLTRALAAELAPAIRVNAIAPSITDTPLAASLLNTEEKRNANAQRHPLRKIGTPQDIANLAAFLLSDQAAWISGQIMHADGGMSSLKV